MKDKAIIDLYWSRDEAAIRESEISYGAYCSKVADNILQETAKNVSTIHGCAHGTHFLRNGRTGWDCSLPALRGISHSTACAGSRA